MSIILRKLYTKEAANKAAIETTAEAAAETTTETAAEAAVETAVRPISSPSAYTSSKYI